MKRSFYEHLDPLETPETASTRSFAIVMTGAFSLLGLWLWWQGLPRWTVVSAVSVGAVIAMLGWLWAETLAPLNRCWHRLGLLLGVIVSPILMGLVFFVLVTPIAIGRRLIGARSLQLRFDPALDSYWQRRDPPGPLPGQLPRQY